MEQLLEGIAVFGRMLLAGMFALAPGTLVWLLVIGIYAILRRISLSGPYQHLLHRGGAA
jgi:hypothetical protein